MDLSFEGPPFNPLQVAALCQALQCFADCLSCLSFQKKTLCTHVCAQALSVSVCVGGEKAWRPTDCCTSSKGAALYPWFCPQFCCHSHPIRED